ncbi:uncharacterized protein LOC143186673 [Calliopsis andreniformis]|uniref:uncharacterized protein LOC143186673 n=1 Tax=Calliopsis andreniformis TaxID=337506 RepID=UPI003FCCA0F4
MERQTRIVLIALWVTLASENFALSSGVSSQISLNQRRDEASRDVSQIVVNLNEVDGQTGETSKEIVFRSGDDDGFVKSNNMKKRVAYFVQDTTGKESNTCGDIKIVLNRNDTKPGVAICENGACEVSVSSHRDEDGNIVTDVHLKITRKVEDDPKINDIPVVDGVRGLEDTYDQPSNFQPVNPLRSPTYFRNNNIPQIQTRYQGGEPWYQGRRTYQSPQGFWRYHRPGEPVGRFPGHSGWSLRRPVVDDKIDPPLSKSEGNSK